MGIWFSHILAYLNMVENFLITVLVTFSKKSENLNLYWKKFFSSNFFFMNFYDLFCLFVKKEFCIENIFFFFLSIFFLFFWKINTSILKNHGHLRRKRVQCPPQRFSKSNLVEQNNWKLPSNFQGWKYTSMESQAQNFSCRKDIFNFLQIKTRFQGHRQNLVCWNGFFDFSRIFDFLFWKFFLKIAKFTFKVIAKIFCNLPHCIIFAKSAKIKTR